MRLRFKARRIPGKDAITFRNPHGEPVYLKNIGDITQELDPGFAHSLLGQFGDILEPVTDQGEARPDTVVEEKMVATSPENKAAIALDNRASGLRKLRQKGFTQPAESSQEVIAAVAQTGLAEPVGEVTTSVAIDNEKKQSE